MVRAAPALMALGLAACLKDAPLVEPGRVYDPETAIRVAKYQGLDSIEILLVDEGDTSRVERIWGGPPDTTARLPARVAGEGERFHYRVEGYKEGLGKCYSEIIREGTSVVRLDTCNPAPRPRFTDSVLVFGAGGKDNILRFTVPDGYSGVGELICRPNWISVTRDTVRLEHGKEDFTVTVHAMLSYLAPGTHSGTIQLRDRNGVLDSLAVRAVSLGIDLLPDTLRFDNFADSHSVWFTHPFTVEPGWETVEDASWLNVAPGHIPDAAVGPGYPTGLVLFANRKQVGPPQGRFSTTLYFVAGPPETRLDSMVVILQKEDWPGGVGGQVRGWDGNHGIADAEVELIPEGQDGGTRTKTDSAGHYAFPSLRKGKYRLVATAEARLGTVAEIGIDSADTAVDLRVSPRYAVTAVDLEAGSDRIGSIAVVDGFAVLPRIAAGPGGKVTGFSVLNVNNQRIVTEPVARADSTPVPAGEAAEAAGNASRLFLSYPFDSTLAMATAWKTPGQAAFTFRKVGFRPYGLLLDGETLVCAGILPPGRLVVARYQGSDLSLIRLDTLTASLPVLEARDSLNSGPRLALLHDHYFITEGDGPKGPGEGKVRLLHRTQAQPLPAPAWVANLEGLNDALVHDGWLYLAGGTAVRSGLKEGVLNGKPGTVYQAQHRVPRLAAARFAVTPVAYLAAATTSDTVLVFSPLHPRPVGKLVLPAGGRGRSLAVHGNTGRFLIGDGRKVYVAGPEAAPRAGGVRKAGE